MAFLQILILFLNFFIFSIVYSEKICPNSFCENDYFTIQYPFKLLSQNLNICNNYTDLICNFQNSITILNLPFSGDFYVHNIDYYTKRITLYDPGNCLAKRLINLNLSSSPFEAIYYQNYTFYSCPGTDSLYYRFKPIGCLSNLTNNVTVATASVIPDVMNLYYNCSVIFSSEIPVSWIGEYDNIGISNDFQLTWNVPDCNDCEERDPTGGSQSKWSKLIRSPFFIPLVVILTTFLGIACFLSLMKLIVGRDGTQATVDDFTIPPVQPQSTAVTAATGPRETVDMAATPSQSTIVTIGIDELKMKSFTELVGPGGAACAICLEEYHCEETIRCITQCGHYFHADCIDQWLQKSQTCPVCRTSLSDVKF
ncbi:RING/U-box superfamily protein [Forsythia ovata]|uniref:RING-type E3 ubiquitin transferase n=1 Tax=Forsythia ovata TaxID=205694 RepID=A0ABD1Q2B6_9LAMI